jgi:hypothetical protein
VGEHHRHQHVDISEARDDPGLVRHDDLAGNAQFLAYRAFEAGGEHPDNPDLQHGWSPFGGASRNAESEKGAAQFPQRELEVEGRTDIVLLHEGF